jgi:DNA-binding NarL/FixJ family response regulator
MMASQLLNAEGTRRPRRRAGGHSRVARPSASGDSVARDQPVEAPLVRILVADDHEVVRRGVRALLEGQPGWQVCGEAVTGREAVEKAKQLVPDVVVMDIGMPDLNGLDATRQVRKDVPESEVLILTMHESEQVVREVLDAGARGYVLKSDAGRDLVTAVGTIRKHRPFFTSSVADMVLNGYLHGGTPTPPADLGRLTVREREVVQLLAEGKSNKEVGTLLGITTKTAETHRTNIMRKLDMHSMSELVRYAIRNKMIEP